MIEFTDVFIYAKDNCPRCKMLKTKLDNAGIAYHVIKDFDPEELRMEGFEMLPVLSVDGELMDMFRANRFIEEAMKI